MDLEECGVVQSDVVTLRVQGYIRAIEGALKLFKPLHSFPILLVQPNSVLTAF